MIQLTNVTDRPHLFGAERLLLEGANLTLPNGRYALLSQSPELHPALIDVIAGLRPPQYGVVHHDGLLSWPVGRMGFVRGKLTGAQLARFICDLYGVDYVICMDFLEGILTHPEYLRERLMHWPPYLRQEYTFSLSLVPDFDMFIIDSLMPLDKSTFSRLWAALFEERIVGRALLFSGYSEGQLMDYCTKGLIYEQGTFRIDDDLEGCIRKFPLKQSRTDKSSDSDGEDDGEFDGSDADAGLFF